MKKIVNNIKENYVLVIAVLIAGLFLGWLFFHSPKQEVQGAVADEEQADAEEVTWTCSMHPQVRQDEPGDCPICGMDLIPVSTAGIVDTDIDADEIMISEEAAKLADIQTVRVERRIPENTLFLQGRVQVDERNMAELTARFGGRIEKLYVSYTGARVTEGQKLATIYSPEMMIAQAELLEAVQMKESRPAMYRAARSKLKLWDLRDEQINSIEQKGKPSPYFDILSPLSGTVMEKKVSQGTYVNTGDEMFMLAGLSEIWVIFDAYEDDIPWVKTGDKINFTIQSLPGTEFSARVSFIDPFIGKDTRTAGLRVELGNRSLKLKPGMFAEGTLFSDIAAGSEKLLIPKSAVLWTGKHAVVYVKIPDREMPSFLYREIELGPEAGDYYVVADGLEEGEEIAVNGVFKIDAAAQLEGKPSMMNPGGGKAPAAHDHGAMDMSESEAVQQVQETGDEEIVQDVPGIFKEQLTEVYNVYIDMKDAFVAADAARVSEDAGKMAEQLEQVDMGLLEGAAHMEWMEHLELLNNSLDIIEGSSDIDVQRKEFISLNNTFYETVKTFGIQKDSVYYQYCPMADNDRGAYWLSNEKEIRNPYFGDMMLTCGEVREVIKSDKR